MFCGGKRRDKIPDRSCSRKHGVVYNIVGDSVDVFHVWSGSLAGERELKEFENESRAGAFGAVQVAKEVINELAGNEGVLESVIMRKSGRRMGTRIGLTKA